MLRNFIDFSNTFLYYLITTTVVVALTSMVVKKFFLFFQIFFLSGSVAVESISQNKIEAAWSPPILVPIVRPAKSKN